MTFDFFEPLFDDEGRRIDARVPVYEAALMEAFVASPEGREIAASGAALVWTELLVHCALDNLEMTPAEMDAADFYHVVFALFPVRVCCSADDAPEIVRELRAFWRFVERAFGADDAASCLSVLDDAAPVELARALEASADYDTATFARIEEGEGPYSDSFGEWSAWFWEDGAPSSLPPASGEHLERREAQGVRRRMRRQQRALRSKAR